MEPNRFLSCLTDDHARLRAVATADLTAAVPSCPGWTVADLVAHVAEVYLHKTECIRSLRRPDPWPPEGLTFDDPLALLDRAWADLAGEFAAHAPSDPAYTWYEPDQTVGFWIRRMAQETVIHRVDAELALGEPLAPIPDDLADDGIDEVLTRFLGYGSTRWPDEFASVREAARGCTVRVSGPRGSWLVRTGDHPVEITTEVAGAGGPADAHVTGDGRSLLLWLWNRAGDETVSASGDPAAVAELRAFLAASTV